MAQRPLWHVEVAASTLLTPHLRQVLLQGESLLSFPRDAAGDYIKLLLPKSSEVDIDGVDQEAPDLSGFFKRSFTVRSVQASHIELWVTEHSGGGPAASWLNSAGVGERCLVTGPGPVDRLNPGAKTWLLCGDLPGLAGIAANLARLPPSTQARVAVEIPEESARLEFPLPSGVRFEWVMTDTRASHGDALVEWIQNLDVDPSQISAWAACEYSVMKRLRSQFCENWQLPKSRYYLSSYWKIGNTDEEHKLQRKQDFPEG